MQDRATKRDDEHVRETARSAVFSTGDEPVSKDSDEEPTAIIDFDIIVEEGWNVLVERQAADRPTRGPRPRDENGDPTEKLPVFNLERALDLK